LESIIYSFFQWRWWSWLTWRVTPLLQLFKFKTSQVSQTNRKAATQPQPKSKLNKYTRMSTTAFLGVFNARYSSNSGFDVVEILGCATCLRNTRHLVDVHFGRMPMLLVQREMTRACVRIALKDSLRIPRHVRRTTKDGCRTQYTQLTWCGVGPT
jgi:hypothetical protein